MTDILRLMRDRRGMALVEFAILLPVLLTLFLGGFQLAQASACKRRVTIVARALSDLVSQYDTITPAEVGTILNATAQIMAPFDIDDGNSRVSIIAVDSSKNAKVVWSEAKNTTELSKGSTFSSLPAAMKIANTYYVYSEVNFTYSPMGGRFAYPFSFNQTLFMVPRKSTSVDCSAC
ncbi:TadE/TadG family type IV pilus assembly protein [Sphingomonas mollis]|uniref:Pilus assembly protein n=1 Tax=Sphingomonas mollis TaxID=2795726 RepID=A0ABS0XM72_9SPHN|nr:TadE/TadG family type IV pilus assembly protein [Sphingomonas sp. BT553]MBJ6121124.1 pilus assembly protein [Sphingomonas sp. BT553]